MNATQTATIEPEVQTDERPQPIRIIREKRWNRTTRQYELVVVTRELIEQTRRREAFVAAFNPCGL